MAVCGFLGRMTDMVGRKRRCRLGRNLQAVKTGRGLKTRSFAGLGEDIWGEEIQSLQAPGGGSGREGTGNSQGEAAGGRG